MPDHMLVMIPPKYSIASVMGYLKGEEFAYDIRPIFPTEVYVWESVILERRAIRQNSRIERSDNP